MKNFDLIIVGAGPAGIFTALEFSRRYPQKKILLLEKGPAIEKRKCPKRTTYKCYACHPCSITTGFSGAGAFSDGKLTLSTEVGGILKDIIGYEKTKEMIEYVDKIYLSYGADKKIYGLDQPQILEKLKHKAIESNLKLVECPIRHLGTDKSYEIYRQIQIELLNRKINIKFNTPARDLIISKGSVQGVRADEEYYAPRVVVAVGREGADWLQQICTQYQIATKVGGVDIGVRVEVRNEIMEEANKALYENKLIYYTPTFDDRVRTFCQNPSGVVATEYYENNLAVVNGHSYKEKKHKTNNTNFAILVSNYFTHPFKEPIEFGKSVARLANMLSGNKIIIQRYGDFRRGRRTTTERLTRNNIHPTLSDAVPGDLSLVLPYRIMLDIKEMIEALNHIFPGLSSDETLLYGVEVKFYSNIIQVNKNFETNIKGLYAAGDGAGLTRGLMQASINGALIGQLL